MAPSVSVIIPTYERRELVRRAVASVLAQTYRDFELIVIDDGSTDGTAEVLAGVDERMLYRWQQNKGVAAARNAGLRLARGEIVAFLDSDNRWLHEHLTAITEVLHRWPAAVAASTCPAFIVAGRQGIGESRLVDHRMRPQFFHNVSNIGFVSCAAVRREAIEAVGGFDERMAAMEDTDFFARLATMGPFATVRRRTIAHQVTAGSLSERARRSGARLASAERAASNLADAADHLPAAMRTSLLREARGMGRLASAMSAIDRRDSAAAVAALEEACRTLPWLSRLPAAVEYRTRRYLSHADDWAELLRSAAMLAELWPDRCADTARYMRAFAIAIALRRGRPWAAVSLLARWPRGGTLGFARRVAPVAWHRVRRRFQERRSPGFEGAELGASTTTTGPRPVVSTGLGFTIR